MILTRFRWLPVLVAAMSATFTVTSCGGDKFHIEGSVAGATDSTLYLEKSDFAGRWMPVDSTRIGGNGNFGFRFESPADPEIYRIRMGERYIYIPVDSTENLSVSTTLADFGTKFEVKGSAQAERMAKFDRDAALLANAPAAEINDFKRKAFAEMIHDARGSVTSYYVLTKTVGGKPLFSIDDPEDAKYFMAVATSFNQYRPNDPRTKMLSDLALEARKRRNASLGRQNVIEAQQVALIDVTLPDAGGKSRSLSEFAAKGPVLLIFSRLDLKDSPALTMKLRELHNTYGSRIAFYQVSLDSDLYAWREAAQNLPWTVVYDSEGDASKNVLRYNVSTLPTFFIYNANGELSERVESLEKLPSALSKY